MASTSGAAGSTPPTIICGGGVMGCSTAYHLAKRGVRCIILESTGIASGASGRSGGFLPRDWCLESPMGDLITASFQMHMDLAEDWPECDYRRVNVVNVIAQQGHKGEVSGDSDPPRFIDHNVMEVNSMGTPDCAAQVNPYKLTNMFFNKAQELAGTEVRICEVSGFKVGKDKTIRGVKLKSGDTISSNRVIITMGAWCSKKLIRSFGVYRVAPHKAASIVMRAVDTSPDVVFMSYTPKATREREDSEWHPRKDGTLFVCGEDNQVPLPERVSQVSPSPAAIARIKATVEEMAPGYSIRTFIEQACYLPATRDGLPLIGKVRGIQGLFMATGHSVWGILSAPATGFALAELIVDGHCKSFDLTDFDPSREDEPDDY